MSRQRQYRVIAYTRTIFCGLCLTGFRGDYQDHCRGKDRGHVTPTPPLTLRPTPWRLRPQRQLAEEGGPEVTGWVILGNIKHGQQVA